MDDINVAHVNVHIGNYLSVAVDEIKCLKNYYINILNALK